MVSLDESAARILACDFGTGGLTIGLFNPHSNVMEAFGQAGYDHLDSLANPRWLEQDPRDWIQAIPRAMDEIRNRVDLDSVHVVGIGIGGHMHALVVLDENDQCVLDGENLLCGAIMWNDPRGEEQGKDLAELLAEPIPARMTASRIRWFSQQHPEAWKQKVHRVCVPSTYIALVLTGQFGVGPGEGSGMMGQLDESGQFAREKLDIVADDLYRKVPHVGKVGEVLGRLKAQGAELLGLPEDIPVAYPEGDQPIGMVASGCASPGQASISLGNSVVFNAVGTGPILNQRGVIDSFRTATNDHLLMTCVTSGTIVYDELVDCFSPLWKGSKDALRDWLADEAQKVPPGCNGVLAFPFYLGEGVFRQPNAFGSFLGFRQGQLNAGVLARASLEAGSLIMRFGYNRMKLGGLREIVLSGGGSNNTLWPQIIADVFQVPVRKPQDAHEAATRGAAYLALFMVRKQAGDTGTLAELLAQVVQLGDPIDPIPEHAKPYEEMLESFEQTLDQLTPLYQQPWFSPKQ